jgi:hypothetical protein
VARPSTSGTRRRIIHKAVTDYHAGRIGLAAMLRVIATLRPKG